MPALVVRFPDGSKEFRYPEQPLEVGDAIWHDGERYRVLQVQEHEGGDLLTVTVEPDPQGLGNILGSEEGAVVLEPA